MSVLEIPAVTLALAMLIMGVTGAPLWSMVLVFVMLAGGMSDWLDWWVSGLFLIVGFVARAFYNAVQG